MLFIQNILFQVILIVQIPAVLARNRKVCNNPELQNKKYRKAEYVQRRVPSTNVQVLFVFEVVRIVIFHHKSSSIITRLPS